MHTNLLSPALQQSFCWFVCPLSALRTTSEKAKLWRVSLEIASQLSAFDRSASIVLVARRACPASPQRSESTHTPARSRKKLYPAHARSGLLRAGSKDDQQHPNFSCSMYDLLPRTSCVASIASKPPRHQFPCDARSSSRKRSSNVSSSLSASCASVPMASSTTRSPQFKLAVSTSSKLAAEKFSSPLQIVILLLYLITYRTNSAAGRACSPSLLTISTSLRMREKGAAWTCFLPAAMKPTIKQSAKPFKTTLRLSA